MSRVPSVSAVLGVIHKEPLFKWANRIGLEGIALKDYSSDKRDLGTLVHRLAQQHIVDPGPRPPFLKDHAESVQETALHAARKFYKWWDDSEYLGVEGTLTEHFLKSQKLGYCGRVDVIAARKGGEFDVIDFKTSPRIYDDHIYQSAAYLGLARDAGFKAENVLVVQLGRDQDEGFSVKRLTLEQASPYMAVFWRALQLHKALSHPVMNYFRY